MRKDKVDPSSGDCAPESRQGDLRLRKGLLWASLTTVFVRKKPATSHLVSPRTLFDICGEALRIAVGVAFASSAGGSLKASELVGRAHTQQVNNNKLIMR